MVTLRLLEPSDAPLLLRWLKDPRVLEYWEGPHEVFTPGRIREEFYEDPDPTTRCIVQYGGRDIGSLQFYPGPYDLRHRPVHRRAGALGKGHRPPVY